MSAGACHRSTTTLWRRTTTGVVLLPSARSEPLQLTGAAALVWDLLDEPTSTDEAIDLLARACGEEPSRVRSDVESVIEELLRLGAAEREDPPAC